MTLIPNMKLLICLILILSISGCSRLFGGLLPDQKLPRHPWSPTISTEATDRLVE